MSAQSRAIAPASRSIFDYSFDELRAEVGEARALDLFQAAYQPRGRDQHALLTNWAKETGGQLSKLVEMHADRGQRSTKFMFRLQDGFAIESVLIRRRDGFTACISSQVGCAFACRFCASGQAGLKRNLTSGEIVEQVIKLGPQVNRIVFMGIGEPLNNYDQVLKAIRTLRDRRGRNFSAAGITISSIGIPKALKQLREEHLAINLTISLHATTQETRTRLIPGSAKHDINEVISRALSYAERHNRIVTFVYLLIPGVNDSRDDLKRLRSFFRDQPARVNLMRWNPVEGISLGRTTDRSLSYFRDGLQQSGVSTVVRDTQGRDISAACGQLWLRDLNGLPLATRNQPGNDRAEAARPAAKPTTPSPVTKAPPKRVAAR